MPPRAASDVLIRPATPADIEAVWRFNLLMARELGRPVDPAAVRRGVRTVLGDPDLGRYFLALAGGGPVGQIQVVPAWDDWRDGFVWWADGFVATPAGRRLNAARPLSRHVLALADADPQVVAVRLEKKGR
jgi:hypothetical protein